MSWQSESILVILSGNLEIMLFSLRPWPMTYDIDLQPHTRDSKGPSLHQILVHTSNNSAERALTCGHTDTHTHLHRWDRFLRWTIRDIFVHINSFPKIQKNEKWWTRCDIFVNEVSCIKILTILPVFGNEFMYTKMSRMVHRRFHTLDHWHGREIALSSLQNRWLTNCSWFSSQLCNICISNYIWVKYNMPD